MNNATAPSKPVESIRPIHKLIALVDFAEAAHIKPNVLDRAVHAAGIYPEELTRRGKPLYRLEALMQRLVFNRSDIGADAPTQN